MDSFIAITALLALEAAGPITLGVLALGIWIALRRVS